MSDQTDIHPFPAKKVGAFPRALDDPEGTGRIEPAREREITRIEEGLSAGRIEGEAESEGS